MSHSLRAIETPSGFDGSAVAHVADAVADGTGACALLSQNQPGPSSFWLIIKEVNKGLLSLNQSGRGVSRWRFRNCGRCPTGDDGLVEDER